MGGLFTYNTKEWLYSAIEMENDNLVSQILKFLGLTTPLSRAVWRGQMTTTKLLIDLGADANYAGPTGISPIMWASKRGHRAILDYLISQGASLEKISQEGYFSLQIIKQLLRLELPRLSNHPWII